MFITIGDTEYELSTKLVVAMKIEQKFKIPLTAVFEKLEFAEIPELISMLSIAAGTTGDAAFAAGIHEIWDYTDLQRAVQELITRLMFSGDAATVEAKLEKFSSDETQKNAIRELLGMEIPAVPVSTGSE